MCIPAEGLGPPPDWCGVFASSAAPAGGDGTKARPLRTLVEALASAEPGSNVYACGEAFDEAVTVPAGVRLYGALDCKNGFRYAPGGGRTVIAPVSGVALIVSHGDEEETRIVDVRVVAPPAREPGGSSIAALVDRADVAFVRTTLIARNAADGLDGEPFTDVAPPGLDGAPGADACTAADVPGGEAVTTLCQRIASTGGRGGDGGALEGQDGDDGAPAASSNHGEGQPANDPAARCSPGSSGASGEDGAPGLGGGYGGRGAIGTFGYSGLNGAAGAPGAVAQGGGGGGGVRGGAICGGPASGGASGGSGGSGGCGGLGGRGGMAGGASIALISLSPSRVRFEKAVLIAGRGGDGGDGGPGQLGGEGGHGAPGGGAPATLLPGCPGGDGGRGGQGGRGGGGAGGHTIGIAFTGAQPPNEGASISHGAYGRGGTGDGETGKGADGIAADTLDMTP